MLLDLNGRRPVWRPADVAVVLVLAALVLMPLLAGGGADDDEGMLVELPSIRQIVAALRAGALPLWTDQMGIGMPIAYADTLALHPLAFLLTQDALDPGSVVFFAIHLALGAWFFFLFCRELGCSRGVAWICVVSLLLSSPSINYLYRSYWPVPFFSWAFAPVVLYLFVRLLRTDGGAATAAWSLALGLCTGLWLLNSHPGVSSVTIIAGAIFAGAAWRSVVPYWKWLLLSGAVAAAIVGYRLQILAHGIGLQPEELERATSGYLSFTGYLWGMFVKPFTLPSAADVASAWSDGRLAGVFEAVKDKYVTDNSPLRVVFIGPVFALLLIYAAVSGGIARQRRLPLALAALTCAVLSLIPYQVLRLPSAHFLYADAVSYFGIPLVGLLIARWSELRPRLTAGSVAANLGLQLVGVLPGLVVAATALPHDGSSVAPRSYRGFYEETALLDFLRAVPVGTSDRIYVSPQTQQLEEVWPINRHFGPGLVIRGFSVVTGHSLKGISLDGLYPDRAYGIARITPQADVIKNSSLLDVLGIRFVMATPGEAVAAGLVVEAEFTTRLENQIAVYRNPTAWNLATFVTREAAEANLPLRISCEHDRLLCRDFDALRAGQQERTAAAPPIRTEQGFGRIRLTFDAANADRVILLNTLYRAEWHAFRRGDGRAVRPFAVAGELMALEVPAGTAGVDVVYGSNTTKMLFALSLLTLISASAALLYFAARAAIGVVVP